MCRKYHTVTTGTRSAESEVLMDEKARAARNAYKRKWYQKNKDKQKQYAERHWNKVAAQEEAAAIREKAPQPAN